MAEDAEQYMLMELEKKLDQAQSLPVQVTPEEVVAIGASAGLDETQSYRTFDRLRRQGRIIGDVNRRDRPPGWMVFWLEDVQL